MTGIKGSQQYYGLIEQHAKRMTKHMPFRLVYGKEAVMPLEFVVPSLRVSLATQMTDDQSLQHRLDELMELEEDRMMVDSTRWLKRRDKRHGMITTSTRKSSSLDL
jgi:hypothetical protein